MEDTKDKPRPHRRATWLIVTMLVVVFVLYPLSMGPMNVVHRHSSPAVQVMIRAFYSPVARLSTKTGTDEILDKYMKWWDPILDP
jgi:hypothetical protein